MVIAPKCYKACNRLIVWTWAYGKSYLLICSRVCILLFMSLGKNRHIIYLYYSSSRELQDKGMSEADSNLRAFSVYSLVAQRWRIHLQWRRLTDVGSNPGSGRFPEGGNDYPLQYSCLGNPRDRGAWWATVHEVSRVWHNLETKRPPPQCLFKLCWSGQE